MPLAPVEYAQAAIKKVAISSVMPPPHATATCISGSYCGPQNSHYLWLACASCYLISILAGGEYFERSALGKRKYPGSKKSISSAKAF